MSSLTHFKSKNEIHMKNEMMTHVDKHFLSSNIATAIQAVSNLVKSRTRDTHHMSLFSEFSKVHRKIPPGNVETKCTDTPWHFLAWSYKFSFFGPVCVWILMTRIGFQKFMCSNCPLWFLYERWLFFLSNLFPGSDYHSSVNAKWGMDHDLMGKISPLNNCL